MPLRLITLIGALSCVTASFAVSQILQSGGTTSFPVDNTGKGDAGAAINSVLSLGKGVVLPCGTYKIEVPIVQVLGNQNISGAGYCTLLADSNSSGNTVTIGPSVDNTNWSNLRLAPAVKKTSGAGLFLSETRYTTLTNIYMDSATNYNCVVFSQFLFDAMFNLQLLNCGNDGVEAFGNHADTFGAQLVFDPSSNIAFARHDGFVIGGGTGGIEILGETQTSGRYGIYCTNSFAVGGARWNREIFFGGPGQLSDTNVSAGVYFDTGCLNGGFVIANGGWFTGTSSGPGIQIRKQTGPSSFVFQGVHLNSNYGGGLITADGGVLQMTGSFVQSNGLTVGHDGVTANSPGPNSQIMLSDNFIGNNGSGGVGFGINLTGVLRYYVITSNVITGNSQGPVNQPGTTPTRICANNVSLPTGC